MASFNRVILMGNICKDIELRYVGDGMAVTDVRLAVNDRRKNASGEWIEETTFVDVTLWGRTAEVANQYLSKGSPMFIEGRLKLDSWEKDGQKHSRLRVVGERLQLLPRGGGGGKGGGGPQPDVSEYSRPADEFEPPPQMAAASASGTQPQQGEDIPF